MAVFAIVERRRDFGGILIVFTNYFIPFVFVIQAAVVDIIAFREFLQ